MLHPRTKIVATTFIGTFFGWLEYASFTCLLPVISTLFFPTTSSKARFIGAVTIVFSTYIIRPVGAIMFGSIGDKYGRKIALSIALSLMGISSLVISYLPPYNEIGLLASILLMFCRCTQGLAIAGEMNGASIFLLEHTHNHFPTVATTWPVLASGIGILLGVTFPNIMKRQFLLTWGWRIPFLFSTVSCFIFAYLRVIVNETPIFTELHHDKQLEKKPLTLLFCCYKNNFMKSLMIGSFIVIYFVISAVYLNRFLTHQLKYQPHDALALTLLGSALMLALMPIIAMIADKIGGRNISLMGLIGCCIIAPLLFILSTTHSPFILISMQAFFAFFTASAFTPLFLMQIRLFPPAVRYTALSLTWAISLSLFSTTTLLLMNQLWLWAHSFLLEPFIASMCALIILIMVFTIPRPGESVEETPRAFGL